MQHLDEMKMNVWHTVIQCTVVLEFSPKDTRLHLNTLLIRSLLEVNFFNSFSFPFFFLFILTTSHYKPTTNIQKPIELIPFFFIPFCFVFHFISNSLQFFF